MQTNKSLKYWQWRTIIVTMLGYAMFYLVRKNFSFSMPGLGAEFGITKTQLGIFLTLHGVIYGFSRFLVGMIADRNSARVVMSVGLMLCAVKLRLPEPHFGSPVRCKAFLYATLYTIRYALSALPPFQNDPDNEV